MTRRPNSLESAGSASLVVSCLRDPGYTPPRAALDPLLDELARLADDEAEKVERALARSGLACIDRVLAILPNASHQIRPRLYRLLARLAAASRDPRLFEALSQGLADPLARCRRFSARALGSLDDPRAEPALLKALENTSTPDELGSLLDALGKLGTSVSLPVIAGLPRDNAEVARRLVRATLMIERRSQREQRPEILLDRRLPGPVPVAVRCRAGLAEVLADELSSLSPTIESSSRVTLLHPGSLGELLVARTALDFALLIPIEAGAEEPEARIVRALTTTDTVEALSAWTHGPLRFRLAWRGAGHQRARSWRVAARIAEQRSALLNDPRQAVWTVNATPDASLPLEVVPQLDPDPRFSYRRRDVPAASHPTIAAALARIARVEPGEVIWDPFVGSGLELIECARLAKPQQLVGSDLDSRALQAARENLESAGFPGAELVAADARNFRPRAVTLIVSNPPMGRRVARDGSLQALLESFVIHAGTVLGPGGRLVWLSPLPSVTRAAAGRANFRVEEGPEVDLGGFSAKIQVLWAGAGAPRAARPR